MSFDGRTASTLDIVDIAFPAPRRRPRRVQPAVMKLEASTVEGDLVPQSPTQTSSSSIEPMLASTQVFTVASDLAAFRTWLERTGAGALLEVVAQAFTRHMGSIGLKVFLETESEEPNEQRALLIAPVSEQQHDALERLFSFIASAWWMSVVRSTKNAIVVDIQHA
jgi:hypothetical protein